MIEIWKDIPKFEGYYKISNYGNVYSYHNNRLLKLTITRNGYYSIDLCGSEGKYKTGVHRLVYTTFIESITDVDLIHHKDGNKLNNRLDNLEKISRSNHKIVHNSIGETTRFKQKYSFNIDDILKEYESYSTYEIAIKYGCSQKTIERLLKKYGYSCNNRFLHMINNRK